MAENKEKSIIPSHIGLIMDGNRRWAKSKKLPTILGHQKGLDALENIIEPGVKKGIKYLTFYSFSTENWNRSKEEVEGLMSLMVKALNDKTEMLREKGAKVKIIGRISDLPENLQKGLKKLENVTKDNSKINIAFAISYGGRTEIIDALKNIKDCKTVSEKAVSQHLYAPDFPEPGLIVRTGGVQRLSGFLLWQAAYSELYFTDTLWPDFNELELTKALEFYANTRRNFGK